MSTKYPAQIDNSITLPSAVDNFTPVQGITVNQLRDAIIAIEAELGVKPSGTYGSVAARLITLETTVGGLKIIELDQDLGGTLEFPLVVGLQGRPVSTQQPFKNDVLTWNGIAWLPAPVHGGVAPFAIDSFSVSPTLSEVGATVANPTFAAVYSAAPATAVLTDSDGNAPQDVSGSPTSFTSVNSYVKNTYGAVETFTLTASDGTTTKADTSNIIWTQKVYWGAGPAGGGGASFITSLSGGGNQLQISQDGTFTVVAGGQKVYYAYRTGYGTASFTVGGFSGGFSLDSTTISLTNSHGFTENYTLYESDNLLPGSVTFTVTHP